MPLRGTDLHVEDQWSMSSIIVKNCLVLSIQWGIYGMIWLHFFDAGFLKCVDCLFGLYWIFK